MEGRFFATGSIIALPSWAEEDGTARVAAAALTGLGGPMHDPPLEPRDEVVFLLTAAAEIEHALMVQYLFAAYSVRVVEGDPHKTELESIQQLLIQIAREEMGHLATVQNLLHLVGGPLNFNREHSPYASEIYPFRFELEGVTPGSLAKYVTAESPLRPPCDMSQADKDLVEQLRQDAALANDGQQVRHVGPIFERLAHLFAEVLSDEDFRLDTFGRQARYEDWGFEPRNRQEGEALIIESFPTAPVSDVRAAAVLAVSKIGAQGEGFDLEPAGPTDSESHFERFFGIYKDVARLSSQEVVITWPVVANPNTSSAAMEQHGVPDAVAVAQQELASAGRITHPRALAWAKLFNLRYRMLLARFSHFMRLDQALYRDDSGAHQGDHTARGLLLILTFDEMRRLAKIAKKLVQLPKDDPPGLLNAGPPFELPYTLNLPEEEPQRWRTHLDISRAAVRLIRETLQPDEQVSDRDEFLDDLVRLDRDAQVVMQELAEGREIPAQSVPADFQKVVRILEEGVRGFTIGCGAHPTNFWAGKTRDEFIAEDADTPVVNYIQGTLDPDPETAPLIDRLEHPMLRRRMPRLRPAIPTARIGFIRQWITDGCPDNSPPGQRGLDRERDPSLE
ncbi:MAG: ferritin-like domain-containing protein [Pseudonocardiaceae bacterium]